MNISQPDKSTLTYDEDFEEYSDDDQEKMSPDDYADCEDESSKAPSSHPMKEFFMLLGSPVKGWKAIKRDKGTADAFASQCFYPLLALGAFSQFSAIFYSDASVSSCLEMAIIVFVSFFCSFFLTVFACRRLMPGDSRLSFARDFGKKFIMAVLGSLVFFYTIYTLLPPIGEILIFLPIYTLYIIFMGVRFLSVPPARLLIASGIISLFSLGLPIAIAYFFLWLMPTV